MDEPAEPRVLPWQVVADEPAGDLRIFRVERARRRSPSTGRVHLFTRLRAPDWVNVVALTPEGGVVLVEQARHGTGEVTVEIPGGAVDPGETPAAAAARELEEETGFVPAEVVPIGCVEPNPAFLDNRCWTFLATGCRATGRRRPDPAEEIAVRVAPLTELTRLIDDGTIRHALVVAAHDHLQRGLRRRAPWARLVGPSPE